MIRALGRGILRILPEREDALPLVVFVLEIGLVATFIYGLGRTVIGFDEQVFTLAAYLAILMPRLITQQTVKRLPALLVMLLGGIGMVLISALRMWGLIYRLVLNFTSYGIFQAMDDRTARFVDQADIIARMGERFDVLVNNLSVWFQYISTGNSIQVSQVTQLVWGVAAFIILLWTGWFLHLRKRPFLAVIPPIVVLGVNSELTNIPLVFFAVLFGLSLFIVVVSSHSAREQGWTRSGTGFSLDIRMDLWGIAAITCIAAFLISIYPPDLSIRTMLEKLDLIGNERETSVDLTSGLGLAELYPEAGDFGSGGQMPSSHLISAPPEELETHLFDIWVGDQKPVFAANWRTHTYQTYTGHGWLAGETFLRRYEAEEAVISEFEARQLTRQITVWARAEAVQGKLIHANQLVQVDHPVEILWRDGLSVWLDYAMGLVGVPLYTVQVSRPVTSTDQLKASGVDYPDWVISRYLQLPAGLPTEVTELAAEFAGQYSDPFSTAKAIEGYLRQLPYNLDVPVPPADQDVVAYFLFDLKQGYCDYFATAMVVLARGAGLPARVISGYSHGEYQAEDGLFKVTAADAHSWVEIYFAGTGWVEFEPTPSRPLMDHNLQAADEEIVDPEEQDEQPAEAHTDVDTLLLWVGGLVVIPVLGFMSWQRIRYLRLSRSELLLLARDQIFRISALLEVGSPQCLTPDENLSWINARIKTGFSGRLSQFLTRRTPEIIHRLVGKLKQAAYSGISPGSIDKGQLVADLVRVGRATRQIRLAKFFQKS